MRRSENRNGGRTRLSICVVHASRREDAIMAKVAGIQRDIWTRPVCEKKNRMNKTFNGRI
jgi:hypothetical protein